MYCKTQPMLDIKMVSSKDVDNGLVQDRSRPMIIIGSDVVSLYPNLRSRIAERRSIRQLSTQTSSGMGFIGKRQSTTLP